MDPTPHARPRRRLTRTRQAIHPGRVIAEDFLGDYGLTQTALARALRIPRSRLAPIIQGKRGITADTALRLARHFGNAPQFWLGLQAEHDRRTAMGAG